MFKNDFIMRIIEQMGEIIIKITTNRTSRHFPESHENVDEGLRLLGLSRKLTLFLPAQELLKFAGKSEISKDKSGLLLVELMKQDGLIYSDEGKLSSAKSQYSVALDVLSLIKSSDDCEDLGKVDDLSREIHELKDSID